MSRIIAAVPGSGGSSRQGTANDANESHRAIDVQWSRRADAKPAFVQPVNLDGHARVEV